MEENYYAAPPEYEPMRKIHRLSGYVRGWAITDLVFCALRVVLVGFGFFGLTILGPDHPLFRVGVAEVLTGLGICVFGLTGNILLLMDKPLAIPICWINVACTVSSILVGIWQGYIRFSPMQDSELVAAIIGAGFVLAIRVTLLAFYSNALIRAKNVFTRPSPFGPTRADVWQ